MSVRELMVASLLVAAVGVGGCSKKEEAAPAVSDTSAETQPKPSEPADDPACVAALEAVAKNLRVEGGYVVDVDLRTTDVGDEILEHLLGLPRLRALRLAETKITSEGLKTVGQIKTLKALDLRMCEIDGDSLSHLTGLSELVELRFSGKERITDIEDPGMAHIAKLIKLRSLSLDGLWVSEDGIKTLAPLKDLQQLQLGKTLVGNEVIPVLENFPKLKSLRLSKNGQLDATGLAQLSAIKNLEELDLSECTAFFDDALESVGKLTKLKKLNLWRAQIGDAGIAALAPLTNLESLNVDNTRLTDESMPTFSGMTKLTFLHLGSTGITDAGLIHLEPLVNMEKLIVTRTEVTKEGVAALSPKLPKAKIQLLYIEGQ